MLLVGLIVSVLVGILAWVAITAPNAPLPQRAGTGRRDALAIKSR
jgi:hypothetical protein